MKAAITIALSSCRALGKDKHPFNKGVPPGWWPADVPFTVVSEQKQSGLRLLMLRLLSLAEDKELGAEIADELQRQAHRSAPGS